MLYPWIILAAFLSVFPSSMLSLFEMGPSKFSVWRKASLCSFCCQNLGLFTWENEHLLTEGFGLHSVVPTVDSNFNNESANPGSRIFLNKRLISLLNPFYVLTLDETFYSVCVPQAATKLINLFCVCFSLFKTIPFCLPFLRSF